MHIVKCAKNYKGPALYTCPFNAVHKFLEKNLQEHLQVRCYFTGSFWSLSNTVTHISVMCRLPQKQIKLKHSKEYTHWTMNFRNN